jgi:hypothetical protein
MHKLSYQGALESSQRNSAHSLNSKVIELSVKYK